MRERPAAEGSRLGRIVPVLCAGLFTAGAAILHTAARYLPAFNTPHTALEGVPMPRSAVPATPGLCRSLTVVIVDGLPFEAARELPAFAGLRRSGVLRPLRAAFPTYTAPALTAYITGAPPRESGIRLNGDLDRGARGLDDVPALAVAAGARVELWSREWTPFPEVMRRPPGADLHVGRLGALAMLATRSLPDRGDLPPSTGALPRTG
ncbi:MAG: alkaline phosphatase family protein [Byssovorax sp.]